MKLTVDKLQKSYGDADRVLEIIAELSLEFEPGRSYAIVGKSGVGKSTLLHMLGGLERPSSGRVLFGSTDIWSLKADELSSFRGASVGFIFQFHHLLAEFNALENVSMPLLVAGIAKEEAAERGKDMLARVGLDQRLSHRPGELSGGEQQRVAIARALVASPEVVLADEPTGSLDTATGQAIRQLLCEVAAAEQSTLIVATHNQELAKEMSVVFEMEPGGVLRAPS